MEKLLKEKKFMFLTGSIRNVKKWGGGYTPKKEKKKAPADAERASMSAGALVIKLWYMNLHPYASVSHSRHRNRTLGRAHCTA